MAPCQLSLVLRALIILATAVGYSRGMWCVCKQGLSETVLQKTLDYACGAGADCNPITPNGVCYNPNSVKSHCSYAVNSYFQKRNQAAGTCDFGGTASVTASNPSNNGCSFPAASASGSGSTGTTITVPSTSPATPGTTTPAVSGTPTTTTSPYTTTVPAGTSGSTPSYPSGITSGVAPTGVGMNDDSQAGTVRLESAVSLALCSVLAACSVLLLWN